MMMEDQGTLIVLMDVGRGNFNPTTGKETDQVVHIRIGTVLTTYHEVRTYLYPVVTDDS